MQTSSELMPIILAKEQELNQLKAEYNAVIDVEKEKVLNSKGKPMSKSLYLLGFEFESSSQRTPQYLEFHKVFKRELTNLLQPHIQKIEFSKPNHFDATSFFQMKDGRIFYFSLSDLRWFKDSLMIRTAKDFKDYTGGTNHNIKLNEEFPQKLIQAIETIGW